MLVCFLASVVLCTVLAKGTKPSLSPDGRFYLERPNVRPYCMRRPLALVKSFEAWRAVSWSSTVVCATATGVYCGSAWASALVLGLPVLRQSFRFPVLTDQAALAALAVSAATGRWEFAAIGGLFNEKCPVFGAVLVSPLALVGLIPAFALHLAGEKPLPGDPEWLKHPLKEGWRMIGRLAEPRISVLPWGGALLGFQHLDFRGWASVLLGYGQLVAAQDSARLYMYSFLPVVRAVQPPLLPLAALLCWVNPDKDRI